ncbi:MAG: MFS transporter [Chloroflexota bacterium]|nr:MFS transporter [Chloroflexota bacterium]
MDRSLQAVVAGTFTLRFSTGLTGALLLYYLAELPRYGGEPVGAALVGLFGAIFFVAELVLSPLFGVLSDRLGWRPVMQIGPLFGAVAVVMTGLSTSLPVLASTRLLEGASAAASVPSILGYIALATAADEGLRGRAVARFEAATLAGLGIGLVVAGPLYRVLGPLGFFVNAGVYGVSLLIYRFGVDPEDPMPRDAPRRGIDLGRYGRLLRASAVWLLAPSWIAFNAVVGVWTSQSIFQLVREPKPGFEDQLLMGGFGPIEVSIGLAVWLVIFFAGIFYWGTRFKKLRRTTIIFFGAPGGIAMVGAIYLLNHSAGQPLAAQAAYAVAGSAGLFVLAGATPAAIGLLADISESHPADRGLIMGLYSVFLAVGQIVGALLGGGAAELFGVDGLLGVTTGLLLVALLPLSRLRAVEHRVGEASAQA